MKIPKYVKNKISSYIKHGRKLNQLRKEIEDWFENKPISKESIEEILIDLAYDTDVDVEIEANETIKQIEMLIK